MDCSPEYVEYIERIQLPVDTADDEQLMRRKKRRSRHMTMKYDNMSKMIADIEAAKDLSGDKRMVKAEQPWEVPRGEEEVKGKPSEEDQDGGKSEATEKGEHENIKSFLNKKKTQSDQLEGQQMLDTDEAVNNNKARKVSFSDEVSYCEDFTLIKTNKRQKFHSFRKATIIIDKKKTVLVKSMRKLIEKHKTTKLELLEEKEAVAVKIAEVELLKLVLSGKEVELREKEKEISCIKAGVIDIKTTVGKSIKKSVTKLDTVEKKIRVDIEKIERRLAQRWRFVGKKKLLAEKQKLAAMLDTICATSQTLQKEAVFLDTSRF